MKWPRAFKFLVVWRMVEYTTHKPQSKPNKRFLSLSSPNIPFFDIFVSTFNVITIRKTICIWSEIKVKYLHELTETVASLYFSHVIPVALSIFEKSSFINVRLVSKLASTQISLYRQPENWFVLSTEIQNVSKSWAICTWMQKHVQLNAS